MPFTSTRSVRRFYQKIRETFAELLLWCILIAIQWALSTLDLRFKRVFDSHAWITKDRIPRSNNRWSLFVSRMCLPIAQSKRKFLWYLVRRGAAVCLLYRDLCSLNWKWNDDRDFKAIRLPVTPVVKNQSNLRVISMIVSFLVWLLDGQRYLSSTVT